MKNILVVWYGLHYANAKTIRNIKNFVSGICGKANDTLNVFSLQHDDPSKKKYQFYVGERLFHTVYMEDVMIVFEDDDIKLKDLVQMRECATVDFYSLHFCEEFNYYLEGH